MSTFATLRALHTVIADALDDIEHLFAQNSPPSSSSPSPSPLPTPSSPSMAAQPTDAAAAPPPTSTPPRSPAPSLLQPPPLLGSPYTPRSTILRKSKSFLTLGRKRSTTSLHCPAPPLPPAPPPLPALTPTTPRHHSPAPSDLPLAPPFALPAAPRTPCARAPPPGALDFPAPDAPYDAASAAERLLGEPEALRAIARVVSACGQLAAAVQTPFLTLCDASMCYQLPSCMRFLEATHTVEVLRDAGPAGLHVAAIAARNGTDEMKLSHILRLLATHHVLREVAPDVFANTRVSSLMDTGKRVDELFANPMVKYENTNGVSAFVGLCTDELFKTSAHLTEAFALTPATRRSRAPTQAPFNFAFRTEAPFFAWLEGGAGAAHAEGDGGEFVPRASASLASVLGAGGARARGGSVSSGAEGAEGAGGRREGEEEGGEEERALAVMKTNRFRLERFGKAMVGTGAWDAPGAILHAFDWGSLPHGSVVVDVGGGIGSTTMILAEAFDHLRFVVQDRPVVVEKGVAAWQAKHPEMLRSGRVQFQAHDFFTPQPAPAAGPAPAVFLLRVVLHDWADALARRILLRLRAAAAPGARLVLADHVLPLACADDFRGAGEGEVEGVAGVERELARAPLLANLGKASANAYWMDITMQCCFNAQERTLRELVALARSAGWRVVRVARAPGSLFGHLVAVPAALPGSPAPHARPPARSAAAAAAATAPARAPPPPPPPEHEEEPDAAERAAMAGAVLRSATPTFGARARFADAEDVRRGFWRRRAQAGGAGAVVLRALSPLTPRRFRSNVNLRREALGQGQGQSAGAGRGWAE